jgi:peptidoglycan/xylan/chitin deacetylase (PgdA/CDA1 family)
VPSLTVCLTFDFDAISVWLQTGSPSAISRGEFGAVAVPRILAWLEHRSIAATFFVPGHTVLTYPDVVRSIRDAGHELAHHGWVHENPARSDAATERRALEKGLEAFDTITGLRPTGWRSPAWDMSERSVDLLLEYGFRYDSSMMGTDFLPYWVRRGDVIDPDGPYRFGEATDLVEIPVYWGLDDFPVFEFVAARGGLAAPSAVREIWQGDFDFAYRDCPGGVYTLTMHPQVIGRGHRLLMLEKLVDYMAQHADVCFSTVHDAAEAWRASRDR